MVSYATEGEQFHIGTGLRQGMGLMDGCPGKMTGVMGEGANKEYFQRLLRQCPVLTPV